MWEDEHIDHDRIKLNLISVMSYIHINIRWSCYVFVWSHIPNVALNNFHMN